MINGLCWHLGLWHCSLILCIRSLTVSRFYLHHLLNAFEILINCWWYRIYLYVFVENDGFWTFRFNVYAWLFYSSYHDIYKYSSLFTYCFIICLIFYARIEQFKNYIVVWKPYCHIYFLPCSRFAMLIQKLIFNFIPDLSCFNIWTLSYMLFTLLKINFINTIFLDDLKKY